MYKVIRCGEGCCLVIVKKLAGPPTYYRFATWQIHDHEPFVFNEVSEERALSYFAGIADGIGYMPAPEQSFESLEQILAWIEDEVFKSSKAMYQMLSKNPRTHDLALKALAELEEIEASRKK